MTATFGRACLILTLLSLSLAAIWVGLNASHHGVTVRAYTAGMQLQSGPEAEEGSVAPDDESDKAAACIERECPSPKQKFAWAIADDRQPHDSKTFAAPGKDVHPQTQD